MKKITAIASATLLLVALTGCSKASQSIDQDPMPTYTAPEPTYSIDDIFVAAVRDENAYLASNYTDAELVDLGGMICKYFDDGGSMTSLAAYLVTNIEATDEAYSFMGFIIGASIGAYCPQYTSEVS